MNIFSLNDFPPVYFTSKSHKNNILSRDLRSRQESSTTILGQERLRSFSNWTFKSELHETWLQKKKKSVNEERTKSECMKRQVFVVFFSFIFSTRKKEKNDSEGSWAGSTLFQIAHRKRVVRERRRRRTTITHLCFLNKFYEHVKKTMENVMGRRTSGCYFLNRVMLFCLLSFEKIKEKFIKKLKIG